MKKITISDARRRLSGLSREVAKGESFLITKFGIPIAELVPPQEEAKPMAIKFGLMKGKVKFAADFDAPLPDWLLGAFEGKPDR